MKTFEELKEDLLERAKKTSRLPRWIQDGIKRQKQKGLVRGYNKQLVLVF